MFGVANSVIPHLKSGVIRALAVAGSQPLSYLPNVPTVAASGFPGFQSVVWVGLVAPVKTPMAIVAKMNDAVVRALRDPAVRERLQAQGIEPAPSTPAQLNETMKADMARWAKVIKDLNDTGIRAE